MTNEYKVSKTAENVDWESVQKKYSEMLDRYKDELEKASGSGKVSPFTRPMKPYRFENAPLLKAYSKPRPGSDNELDRRRANERCNRIETDAVTNETASV